MRLTPPNQPESLSDQISTENFLSIKVVGVVPRDQNGIELLLTTLQPKPRTGVSLTVTDLAVFSSTLGGPHRPHPPFDAARKPLRLIRTGGDEAIYATKPQVFDLMSQSSDGLCSILYQGGDDKIARVPIPAGVWRVDILVEWTNLSRLERFHVEVPEHGRPHLARDPTERA